MGSIGQKSISSHYSYCMSKAALNMASKLLSIGLKSRGIGDWSIHPGWNRTYMGGTDTMLDPKDTEASLIKIIGNKNVLESV